MKENATLESDRRLTLASADAPLTETVEAIREAANGINTCLASLDDILEEPLKSKFLAVKQQINKVLASLPPTDQVPAPASNNDILRQLLYAFSGVQQMVAALTETAKTARADVQTARASITGEVEKAIGEKVKAGELLPKADHEKGVNDALAGAKTEWQAELKVIGDRRTAIASASLPVPADEKLAGKDEEFKARQEQAKARAEALKSLKVPADKLTALCWDADQATFDMAIEMAKANAPASGSSTPPGQKPNGFIAGTGATKVNLRNILC